MDRVSEDVQKQVNALEEWAKIQPNFPENIDDKLLLRFLHSCYYDIDKAKNAATLFFSIRSNNPELFTDRDPLSPQIRRPFDIVNIAQYEISGNRNIWIWQLNDPGLEKYHYLEDSKSFMIVLDTWLLTDRRLEDCDIIVMDVKDMTLKIITKFSFSIARKISKYQEEAMPLRIKQIHIVNAPPFMDKIYSIIKPLVKKDMSDMMHFHIPNSDTIYKYISKDDLPEDYGGKKDKMKNHMKRTVELIHSQRENFIHDSLWRVDQKSKNKADSSSEIKNFKTLAID